MRSLAASRAPAAFNRVPRTYPEIGSVHPSTIIRPSHSDGDAQHSELQRWDVTVRIIWDDDERWTRVPTFVCATEEMMYATLNGPYLHNVA